MEPGAIYLSFRNALARAISHIVPPRDIEDIVQEAYVRVCQVEQKENIKYPRSFLLKTVKNLALDYVKSAGNRLNLSIEEEGLESAAGSREGYDETYRSVAAKQEFALFCEAVRCLPAPVPAGLYTQKSVRVFPEGDSGLYEYQRKHRGEAYS